MTLCQNYNVNNPPLRPTNVTIIIPSIHPTQHTPSFPSHISPLSGAGAALVLIFGGRKLFYHPDISVSDELRFSNAVQNETPLRLKDADTFREHTRIFATVLEPLAQPMMKAATGYDKNTAKWNLDFTRTPVQDLIPLERTNFFEDGLYEETMPSDLASSDDNYNYDRFKL